MGLMRRTRPLQNVKAGNSGSSKNGKKNADADEEGSEGEMEDEDGMIEAVNEESKQTEEEAVKEVPTPMEAIEFL